MEKELEECKKQMKAIDQLIDQCNANIMENLNQSATLKLRNGFKHNVYLKSRGFLTQEVDSNGSFCFFLTA